jgi:hypothetical protein
VETAPPVNLPHWEDTLMNNTQMTLKDACVSFMGDLARTALDGQDVEAFLSPRQVYTLCILGDCQSVVALGDRYWAINAVNELLASTDTLEEALAALDDPFCLMEGVDGIHCEGLSADEIARRLTWLNEVGEDEVFTINDEPWRYIVETGQFVRQERDEADIRAAWYAARNEVSKARERLARAQSQLNGAEDSLRLATNARRRCERRKRSRARAQQGPR